MNEYWEADKKGREYVYEDFGYKYQIEDMPYTAHTDLGMTANSNTAKTYAAEVKAYTDPKRPRNHDKYKVENKETGEKEADYMIDYAKLENVCTLSKEENRIPVLLVYFSDYLVIWRLDKFDWKKDAKEEWVNADGQHYGVKKEKQLMAHIKPKDAVYKEKNRHYEYDSKRDNRGIGNKQESGGTNQEYS